MAQILFVEDDPALGLVVFDFLQMNGFSVTLATDGLSARDLVSKQPFDLCVLDVMLPGIDGFELARFVKSHNSTIPVIFLTARSLSTDRIEGFRIGCDDYIVKPFNSEELILRIKALLKRCGIPAPIRVERVSYSLGNYTFDPKELALSGPSGVQPLTRREAELLQFFCDHVNELLPREVILKAVWGNDDYFIGRSMDVFITRLRKYLKDDERVSIINSHGNGFKLTVAV